MKSEVKLRLEPEEAGLLDDLVGAIRSRTKMRTNRTAVAMACFREGWLVMNENYPADPTETDQNEKSAPERGAKA